MWTLHSGATYTLTHFSLGTNDQAFDGYSERPATSRSILRRAPHPSNGPTSGRQSRKPTASDRPDWEASWHSHRSSVSATILSRKRPNSRIVSRRSATSLTANTRRDSTSRARDGGDRPPPGQSDTSGDGSKDILTAKTVRLHSGRRSHCRL